MKERYFIPLKMRNVKPEEGRKRTGRAPLSKAPGRRIYMEKEAESGYLQRAEPRELRLEDEEEDDELREWPDPDDERDEEL